MGGLKNSKSRITERQDQARERQKAHDEMSLEDKLAKAKAAPGSSSKEIAKLERQIEARADEERRREQEAAATKARKAAKEKRAASKS